MSSQMQNRVTMQRLKRRIDRREEGGGVTEGPN